MLLLESGGRALGAAVAAGLLALAGLPLVSAEAPDLYEGLTSGAGLAMVALSGRLDTEFRPITAGDPPEDT